MGDSTGEETALRPPQITGPVRVIHDDKPDFTRPALS